MGKDHPIGAFTAVGIASKQRTAVWIGFGHDVHQIRVTPLTEHQLPVSGQRQTT